MPERTSGFIRAGESRSTFANLQARSRACRFIRRLRRSITSSGWGLTISHITGPDNRSAKISDRDARRKTGRAGRAVRIYDANADTWMQSFYLRARRKRRASVGRAVERSPRAIINGRSDRLREVSGEIQI